ncbi:MAG: hypothetical protein ACMXYD_04510 [Candidatus Woesearchaeota archaeon]
MRTSRLSGLVHKRLHEASKDSVYQSALDLVLFNQKPIVSSSQKEQLVSDCLYIIDSLEVCGVALDTRQEKLYDACLGGQFVDKAYLTGCD